MHSIDICHPGVFGTVEMRPSTVGTWLVECHIGEYQLAGMRAKLLVYDPGRYTDKGSTCTVQNDIISEDVNMNGIILCCPEGFRSQIKKKKLVLMCDVYISGLKIFLHRRAECSLPLGMKSGRIEDSQITASDYVGKRVYFFFVKDLSSSQLSPIWCIMLLKHSSTW